MKNKNIRRYKVDSSISFAKTTSKYGGLSNMASGYPLKISKFIVPSSEHLYQLMKFTYYPEIQSLIIKEPNPFLAKKISRKYDAYTREDWNKIKFEIMKWVLNVKLYQHKSKFGSLLKSTLGKDIVEFSYKDKIWAVSRQGDYYLGINALGRLLMELRSDFLNSPNQFDLYNLDIKDPLIKNVNANSVLKPSESLQLFGV